MKNIILFILLVSFVSCKQYKLDGNELQIYNTYNAGDTISFTSSKTGNTKSFVIISKENGMDGGFASGPRYRRADVFYRNINIPITSIENNFPVLVDITNNATGSDGSWGKNGYVMIYFEHAGIPANNIVDTLNKKDTIYSLGKKIINYNLYSRANTSSDTSVVSIIWQQKYGIVKYDLQNGDSYIRTNMPAVVN